MKRTTSKLSQDYNRRLMLVECLERRAMMTNNPPEVILTLDPSLQFGEPHEGSNQVSSDHIADWRLKIDFQDDEGGTFDLVFDLNGNGMFGESGEPPTKTITVPARPQGQYDTYTLDAIQWPEIVGLQMGDTVDGSVDFTMAVRVFQANILVGADTDMLTIKNSLPFFQGTIVPVQAAAAQSAGCGGAVAPVTLSGSFVEYGVNDAVTLRINWGDGNVETFVHSNLSNDEVSFSKQHTYAASGNYTIKWDVWDDEDQALLSESPASQGQFTNFPVTGGGPAGPSVCLAGGVLTVTGSAGNDSAMITQPNGVIRVESSFFPTTEFPAANVQNIVALLGAGNDMLVVNASKPLVAVGGDGSDVINGGNARSILIGGAGNDLLIGGSAQDILVGGATTHDSNAVALLLLLAEWNSAHSFTDRVNNLTNGSGSVQGLNETPSGSFFLTSLGDDQAVDILVGAGSMDWIIRHAGDISMGLADFLTPP